MTLFSFAHENEPDVKPHDEYVNATDLIEFSENYPTKA